MVRSSPDSAVLLLSGPAVMAVAPDELPLLEATITAYGRRSGTRSDELLGFGIEASAAVASIAAVAAARAVVDFLGSLVVDSLREESSDALRAWVRRKLSVGGAGSGSTPAEDAVAAPVSTEMLSVPIVSVRLSERQLHRVWNIAYDHAAAGGMDSEQATAIADAIVQRIDTGT